MIKLEEFYPLIAPWAPGVSEPAMDNAIRNAAIEFCAETLVWTESEEGMPLIANQGEVEIDAPLGGQVARLLEVTIAGVPVKPVPMDSISSLVANWRTAVGQPAVYVQTAPEVFRLVPLPSARQDKVLAYRCAYQPTRRATTLPDILFNRYGKAIANGALGELLAQPGTDYLNPQESLTRLSMFNAAKDDAVIDQFRGFGRAPIRTKGQFF